MNEATYNSLMQSLAADAAEAHALVVKGTDSRFKNPEFASKKKQYIDPNRFYKEILEQLKKKYPRESTSESDFGDLAETKGEVVEKWLYDKGPSPTEYKANVEASKFMPILQGVADEGDDWYSMGNERLKRFASGLGWKVNTPEDYQKFLDKVGEYQQMFDRGKLSKELRDMPGYTLSSIVYPSAVQEIENAVATGEGGDASDVAKLGTLDFLANTGIFMAPSLGGSKVFSRVSPKAKLFMDPAISGLTQSGLEAARQAGKEALSETGQEFEFGPVAATGTIGATIPGIVGTLQAGVQKIPGTGRLGRGISMARRTGDPIEMETAQALENIDAFNNSPWLQQLLGNADEMEVLLTPAEAARLNKIKDLDKVYRDLFGIYPTETGIDKQAVLRNIKKPIKEKKIVGPNMRSAPRESVLLGENSAAETVLDEKSLPIYQSTFPARYESMNDNSKAFKTGRVIGQLGLDVGGRVEPIIKVNPVTAYNKVSNGEELNSYKDASWYTNLDENRKGIIDEAFRQKDLENEFKSIKADKPEAVQRAQMFNHDESGLPLKKRLTPHEKDVVDAMIKKGFEKMLGGIQ